MAVKTRPQDSGSTSASGTLTLDDPVDVNLDDSEAHADIAPVSAVAATILSGSAGSPRVLTSSGAALENGGQAPDPHSETGSAGSPRTWTRRGGELQDALAVHAMRARALAAVDEHVSEEEFVRGFRPDEWMIVEGRAEAIVGAARIERRRREIFVHDLVVAPGSESQGMATAILRELIDEAVRGDVPVAIHVPPRATRALRLLKFLGFVVVPSPVAGRNRLVWRA